METLLVASKNKGKIKEIKSILGGLYNVMSMGDFGIDLEIEETGTTFEQNALIKAQAIFKLTGLPSLADDSGLVVDALNGRPGIYSARYAAVRTAESPVGGGAKTENSTDKANNQKLLSEMTSIKNRAAKFVSAMALVRGENDFLIGIGEATGEVLHCEQGVNGFGYDTLFYSHDLNKSFGEASEQEKNRVSHRYRALQNLFFKLSGKADR